MIINGTVLWLVHNQILEQRMAFAAQQAEMAAADTLGFDDPFDIEPTIEVAERPSRRRRPGLDLPDLDDPSLSDAERSFIKLQHILFTMRYGSLMEEEDEEEEEQITIVDIQAQMDSTIAVMNTQIDSLRSVIELFENDNQNLITSIDVKESEIVELNNSIESLFSMIQTLQDEIYQLQNPEIEEEEVRPPNFRQLARLYNNMDARRVSQLLQRMPPEQSVGILRLMNQRKASQIMAVLPPRVADQYAQIMIDN
jgi:flagellar motility protein MotE (MotC chaperone)